MTNLTKTQTANLTAIWTTKVAAGFVAQETRQETGLTAAQARRVGFTKLPRRQQDELLQTGLAQTLVTKVEFKTTNYGETLTYWVKALVLTEAGRTALGV